MILLHFCSYPGSVRLTNSNDNQSCSTHRSGTALSQEFPCSVTQGLYIATWRLIQILNSYNIPCQFLSSFDAGLDVVEPCVDLSGLGREPAQKVALLSLSFEDNCTSPCLDMTLKKCVISLENEPVYLLLKDTGCDRTSAVLEAKGKAAFRSCMVQITLCEQ